MIFINIPTITVFYIKFFYNRMIQSEGSERMYDFDSNYNSNYNSNNSNKSADKSADKSTDKSTKTLKLLQSFINENNKDSSLRDLKSSSKYAEIISIPYCSDKYEFHIPTIKKEFNIMLTDLPKYFGINLPPVSLGSLADISSLNADRTVSSEQVEYFNKIIVPTHSSQPPVISIPLPYGSIVQARPFVNENPLDAIFNVLISGLANAMITSSTLHNINTIMNTNATALGIVITKLPGLNYSTRLSRSVQDVEIEYPIKWMIGSFIMKINKELSTNQSANNIGIVNQSVTLNINTNGIPVRKFTELNPNITTQNTVNSYSAVRDCHNSDSLHVDYDFFFVVYGGAIIFGLVIFSNLQHGFSIMVITSSNKNTALAVNSFNLGLLITGTSRNFDISYPISGLKGLISGNVITVQNSQIITANKIPITISDITNPLVLKTSTISGIIIILANNSLIGTTSDGSRVYIDITGNQVVDASMVIVDIAATGVISSRLTSFSIMPVYSPAILIRLIALYNDECDKSYMMVNETNFNI